MDHNSIMRVGIIGAGWIAEKAAITLNGLQECEAYAIASRSQEKAEAFASKWNIAKAANKRKQSGACSDSAEREQARPSVKAYDSYSELIADPNVDIVYVATPHSHHFDVT